MRRCVSLSLLAIGACCSATSLGRSGGGRDWVPNAKAMLAGPRPAGGGYKGREATMQGLLTYSFGAALGRLSARFAVRSVDFLDRYSAHDCF